MWGEYHEGGTATCRCCNKLLNYMGASLLYNAGLHTTMLSVV